MFSSGRNLSRQTVRSFLQLKILHQRYKVFQCVHTSVTCTQKAKEKDDKTDAARQIEENILDLDKNINRNEDSQNSLDVRKSQRNSKLEINEESAAKSNESSSLETKKGPKRSEIVKPGVVFQQRVTQKEKPLPNLREQPVDMREIPKKYDTSPVELKNFARSTVLFREASLHGKSKESFQIAIKTYDEKQKVYKKGQAEFIYTCLDMLKDFKVHDDLEIYKDIMSVIPVGELKPKSKVQIALMHKTKYQQCAIDVLDTMESHGCIPDDSMGHIIVKRFGVDSYVMRKYQRMMYWLPKFRNANPYPVPYHLPKNNIELAKLALHRMAVDSNNVVTVWETAVMEDEPLEDTFIASAQSPLQRQMIDEHPSDVPLVVEGGFVVWLRDQAQTYYVLKAEYDPEDAAEDAQKMAQDYFEPEELCQMFEEEPSDTKVSHCMSARKHRQSDGTILAMCITGTCTKDSLATWIRYLSQSNPRLGSIPVLFTIRNPAGELDLLDKSDEYFFHGR